jgi:hypothetical protein
MEIAPRRLISCWIILLAWSGVSVSTTASRSRSNSAICASTSSNRASKRATGPFGFPHPQSATQRPASRSGRLGLFRELPTKFVVPNLSPAQNSFITLIRVTGSRLHAARVLAAFRAKRWPTAPACAVTRSANGNEPRHPRRESGRHSESQRRHFSVALLASWRLKVENGL